MSTQEQSTVKTGLLIHPPEKRQDVVWTACAADASVHAVEGLALGFLASVIVARRPSSRSLFTGMGLGGGAGWAARKCHEKQVWLRSMSSDQ